MRLSLRELVALFTVAALAVPALYYATAVSSSVVVGAVSLITLAMLVRGVALRGPTQTSALSFAVVALLYGAALAALTTVVQQSTTWAELDPRRGSLPTTRLTAPLSDAIRAQRSYWIDPNGKRSTTPPPPGQPMAGWGGGGGAFGGGAFGFGGGWQFHSHPAQENLMATAHALWALALGYAAMKHGGWLARTRDQADPPPAADAPPAYAPPANAPPTGEAS